MLPDFLVKLKINSFIHYNFKVWNTIIFMEIYFVHL